MGLRLLLGRAGTGKTHRCLEEIAAELQREPLGPPLLLIAPAQATFNMERELAALGGSLRAQVYSFRRLAYRVLREAGGAARRPVSELGRRMMLKKILLEERERLHLMGSLHNRPGFLAALSELIGELKMCRITPEDLRELAGREAAGDGPGGETKEREGEGGLLGRKLDDLYLVYRQLAEKLAGGFSDPDDYLDLLAQQIPGAAFLEGCRVWVDGFASFTPQEGAVLAALFARAREVTVTLTLDPALAAVRPADHDPFVKPWETRARLRRLAGETGAAVREEFLAPDERWRLAAAPELAHLERRFFRYPTVAYTGPVQKVHLLTGVNRRAEVEGVVRAIRRLLREESLRPRQIMVAVRDVDAYFPLFRQVLADYGIPCFIDHRQSVMHHPLVELLRSALEVWEKNWAYDPVFRFLKTGLVQVSAEEVDRLENYVLAAGIRGSRWYGEQPWGYLPGRTWREQEDEERQTFPPSELEEIDEIRRKAVKELRLAQEKVQAAAAGRPARVGARRWAAVLVELCLDLAVPEKLDRWSRAALALGRPELAREHRQVWRLVSGLLDELVAALGEAELSAAELSAVLDAGLEAARLSLIPPVLDAVTVGSLDRSRPPRDLQALFLAGLTEGALPARIRPAGVFTEEEREQLAGRLAQKNRELPAGTADRLHQEQFLIYQALTRTAGSLYLSYPLGDDEGRAVTPSPVVRRVRELLPGLKARFLAADPPGGAEDAEYVEHPAGLLPRLGLRFREASWGRPVHPLWWRVYNLLLESEEWRERLAALAAGLLFRNLEPPLGRELGRRLWSRPRPSGGRVLTSSVSRLERFVQCPFAHFLAYGLGLEERAVYEVAPPDTGQLYHEALRRFVTEVQQNGPAWEELGEEEIDRICTEVVESLAPRLQNQILLSSARLRRQKERLLERVGDSARALTRQMRQSGFRPAALEVYFGPREKIPPQELPAGGTAALPFWPRLILPPLELAVDGEVILSLVGRIDRVDLGRGGECLYLRVIDYKSGRSRLDLPGVLAGAQLQLLVYLWAATSHFARLSRRSRQPVRPAGAFYFSVQRPVLRLDQPELAPEELEREWLKEFKLSGWLVDHGPELYSLFDSGLAAGAASLLIPVRLNKDGSPSRQQLQSVYTPAEFQVLIDLLGTLLRRAAGDILAGRVDIAPLRLGSAGACGYCVYRPVCRFDLWLPENRYRSPQIDKTALRRRLAECAARGKGAGERAEAEEEGGAGFVLYTLD
ncbi:MAG: helicase-exonuclease AddAB subunit AddB [Armatimonadetes bacterium]|nr:helicase-exonuclease AddAB subunit AddB [Armatimonadota bacterium]